MNCQQVSDSYDGHYSKLYILLALSYCDFYYTVIYQFLSQVDFYGEIWFSPIFWVLYLIYKNQDLFAMGFKTSKATFWNSEIL